MRSTATRQRASRLTSSALVLLLQAMCLAEPAGSTADEVANALADARADCAAPKSTYADWTSKPPTWPVNWTA